MIGVIALRSDYCVTDACYIVLPSVCVYAPPPPLLFACASFIFVIWLLNKEVNK
jgi:hypothetical protein